MSEPFLSVNNLTIHYRHGTQSFPAVRNVNITLQSGQTLGLVGESGCGKSTLALALMGLLPEREGLITEGQILYEGRDLTQNDHEHWRTLRGKTFAMVFQDPFSSLNPVFKIDFQLAECLPPDEKGKKQARMNELLDLVQLKDPERILNSYPHQLSGGQRQRVLISMALAQNPKLLIADEPTTALDVTVQDEIVKLLKSLQSEFHMAMVFITHNIGLVKDLSDLLAVMYAGEIVEVGKTSDVLKNPKHPYTQGLLRSLPDIKPHQGPLPVLEGQPPEPKAIPTGCAFHPRCEKRMDQCKVNDPAERLVEGRTVRCHLYP